MAQPSELPPTGPASAFEVTHGPSFAMVRVDLAPGQVVVAEAGAMVARHQPVAMRVSLNASPAPGILAVLKATAAGPGQLLVGAFGGIQELVCDGNLVIDTGHLVAWDATLEFSVGKSGSGWLASFLSGEGLVCHFTGQGRIWIQTRNPSAYGRAVGTLLPPRRG